MDWTAVEFSEVMSKLLLRNGMDWTAVEIR
jgi:hypothetical protein